MVININIHKHFIAFTFSLLFMEAKLILLDITKIYSRVNINCVNPLYKARINKHKSFYSTNFSIFFNICY